jgi:hypothetical protein
MHFPALFYVTLVVHVTTIPVQVYLAMLAASFPGPGPEPAWQVSRLRRVQRCRSIRKATHLGFFAIRFSNTQKCETSGSESA